VGRLAKLSSFEPVDGRRHWTGRLVSVEDGNVTICLEREGGQELQVPLSKVAHGRLEVEFPKKS
jgi:ribosome maturation factor RimP